MLSRWNRRPERFDGPVVLSFGDHASRWFERPLRHGVSYGLFKLGDMGSRRRFIPLEPNKRGLSGHLNVIQDSGDTRDGFAER